MPVSGLFLSSNKRKYLCDNNPNENADISDAAYYQLLTKKIIFT